MTFSIAISCHSLNSGTRICHHMSFHCPLQLDSDWPLKSRTGRTQSTCRWLSLCRVQGSSFDLIQKWLWKKLIVVKQLVPKWLSRRSGCVICKLSTWLLLLVDVNSVFWPVKVKLLSLSHCLDLWSPTFFSQTSVSLRARQRSTCYNMKGKRQIVFST